MAPANQSIVYATEQDLLDYMSVQGLQLRLDDDQSGSGQAVVVSATGNLGDTTLSVSALASALTNGTVLTFSGGGMTVYVDVVLTADALAGATSLSVQALPAAVNAGAVAYDLGVSSAEYPRITKATQYATGRVNLYCQGRYDAEDMASSWIVNWWTTVVGTRWLCKRRMNPDPDAVEEDYQEAMAEMKEVAGGQLVLPDIGLRTGAWPAWSNVRVDCGYRLRQVRTQRPISEQSPTQYTQNIDWPAEYTFEI